MQRSSFGLVLLTLLLNACGSSASGDAGNPQAGAAGAVEVATGGASAGSASAGASGSSDTGGTTANAGTPGVGEGGAATSTGGAGGNGAGGGGSSGAGAGGSAGSPATGYVLPAYTSSAAPALTSTGRRNEGRQFVVKGAIVRVRDLGVWDNGANGLAAAHTVTLFSLDKVGAGAKATPIAGGSTTVPAGTAAPLDSGFRYAALPAPIDLEPGTYAVIGYGFDDNDEPGLGGGLPLPALGVSDANFDPYQFVTAASPAFPTGGDNTSHSSASFRFESKKRPLYIMPLGASITDGYLGTMAGYRGPLKKLLDDAGVLFQYVGSATDNPGTPALPREQAHHEGHSGFVIEAGTSGRSGIYDSRQQWLGPSGSQADVFLILIGSNDVSLNYKLDTADQRIDALLTSIIDPSKGLQPKAKIIIAELPPINDPAQDARCVLYNQAIVKVAKAHQMKGEAVSTIDAHSAVKLSELADVLHPNDVGYGKIAKLWFDALQAL